MFKRAIPYFLLSFVFFLFYSCGNRPDEVLNQREMKELLTDLHVLEAVLEEHPPINEQERTYYYDALLQKHGVSKASFDSSLVYYTKNPKVFERIYTRVVSNLDNFKSEVHAGKYFPVIPDSIRLKPAKMEIWTDQIAMHLTKDSALQHLSFSINNADLMTKDIYCLRFLLRIAPQDTIKDTYAALRIHYAGGVVDSLMHETYSDSVFRRYAFMMNAKRNLSIDSLSGTFHGGSLYAKGFEVTIDSITLQRTYVPFLQDTLRMHLDTMRVTIQGEDSIEISDIKLLNILRQAHIKKEEKKFP